MSQQDPPELIPEPTDPSTSPRLDPEGPYGGDPPVAVQGTDAPAEHEREPVAEAEREAALAEPAVPQELSDVPDSTHPDERIEPTEVVEPAPPAEPAEPAEPADPAEPAEPAEPADPAEPAEPATSDESDGDSALAEPAVPAELADVPDPTGPVDATTPIEPTGPSEVAELTPSAQPTEPAAAADAPTAASVASTPTPGSAPLPSALPRPPSPALLAAQAPGASPSAKFGRVDASGTVFVSTGDGAEKEVGAYPGVSPAHALGYFARKYDELAAQVELLQQRVAHADLGAKDAADQLVKLRQQVAEARVVGDLAALDASVAQIGKVVERKRQVEGEERAAARRAAKAEREALVAEAEQLAGQPEAKIQWKASGARMRELLELWKQQQRSGPRLDRESETTLWQRFSAARNSFDKARRVHFAHLEDTQSEVKATKQRLVTEAQALATSQDWGPTATAFKRLMERWRAAGRASRGDDDALWEQFKAAQDSFFVAKDAISAKENEEFSANLELKTQLLHEAEALLPVTTPKEVDSAKTRLRSIQDRWDKIGKVPRADLERIDKALHRVEQTVRDADDKRRHSRNPEGAARAQSFVEQLRTAVAGLSADLEKARASGSERRIVEATAALSTREQWLRQAEKNLTEFGA